MAWITLSFSSDFIAEVLGPDFVGCRLADLDCVLAEWGSAQTPLLFILSPGVDPLHDLEACTSAPSSIQNVSLGQGQETIAEQTMDDATKEGQWVVLQVRDININFSQVPRIEIIENNVIMDCTRYCFIISAHYHISGQSMLKRKTHLIPTLFIFVKRLKIRSSLRKMK